MRWVFLKGAKDNTFVVECEGAKFKISGSDLNEFYLAINGIHSPAIHKAICCFIDDGAEVVWDIGANIGAVSLPVLAARPNARAVAFEPSPAACERLMRNAMLNPHLLDRFQVVNAALSSESGWSTFYSSNQPSNSGLGGLELSANRNAFALLVHSVRGDALAGRLPPPDVVKLDVEGHELEVLGGLGAVLDRRPLRIIFEHGLWRLRERGSRPDAVVNFLSSRGYSIRTIDMRDDIDLGREQDFVAVNGG